MKKNCLFEQKQLYYYECLKKIVNKGCFAMDKEFMEKIEKELIDQKKVIVQSLSAQSEEYKKIMEEAAPGDEVDIASDVIDGKMLETLGTQDALRLEQINNALERIHKGTYGICLICKKEIPRERLEAIPYAFMCIDCKSRDERRNR